MKETKELRSAKEECLEGRKRREGSLKKLDNEVLVSEEDRKVEAKEEPKKDNENRKN